MKERGSHDERNSKITAYPKTVQQAGKREQSGDSIPGYAGLHTDTPGPAGKEEPKTGKEEVGGTAGRPASIQPSRAQA